MAIKVNITGAAITGKIVTFTAPCNCSDVSDGLVINGETYTVCDAMGECVTGKGGAWCAGAQISVVLDCENKKAFIQNRAVSPESIGAAIAVKWDSITVATTAWVEADGLYTATVAVQDMLATDNPHSVDIVRSSDLEADALCEKAFALVKRITTADGSITLYATKIPSVNFTIWMEGTR